MDTTIKIPLSQVEIYGALRYSVERMALLFDVTTDYINNQMADVDSDFAKAYTMGRAKGDAETIESIQMIEKRLKLNDLKTELFGL